MDYGLFSISDIAFVKGRCLPNASDQGVEGWPSRNKLAAVVESASLNGEQIAEYCRRRGLFLEQLERWRQGCGVPAVPLILFGIAP